MKICIATYELAARGGEQRQVLCLATTLVEMGHQVTVCAYRYQPDQCFPEIAAGLTIRAIQKPAADWQPESWCLPRGILSRAQRHFWESRCLAGLLEGDFDVINPHARPAHRAAVYRKRETGVPVVWMLNDIGPWERPNYHRRLPLPLHVLANRMMAASEKAVVEDIDRVTVLDHTVQEAFQLFYRRPARVIRNGVDAGVFQEDPNQRRILRDRHGVGHRDFLVASAGVLAPYRRMEDLIDAVVLLRQKDLPIRLIILGSPAYHLSYFAVLQRQVQEADLESVIDFVPRNVSDREFVGYLSACDAFAFPNETQTWGLAPLEALSCGRPVIVSRGSGVHEVLKDGVTALLVPPRNPRAVAEAIERLLNDTELRQNLARRGQAYVRAAFSWRRYAEQMLEEFEKAVGAQGRKVA